MKYEDYHNVVFYKEIVDKNITKNQEFAECLDLINRVAECTKPQSYLLRETIGNNLLIQGIDHPVKIIEANNNDLELIIKSEEVLQVGGRVRFSFNENDFFNAEIIGKGKLIDRDKVKLKFMRIGYNEYLKIKEITKKPYGLKIE